MWIAPCFTPNGWCNRAAAEHWQKTIQNPLAAPVHAFVRRERSVALLRSISLNLFFPAAFISQF